MGNQIWRVVGVVLGLVMLLSACGGGTSVAGGGTGGTGQVAVASRGTVTQLSPPAASAVASTAATTAGTMTVNGVSYDINTATLNLPAGVTSLQEGMLVTVRGLLNADGISAVASDVTYSRELSGMISATPATNQLVVYGQNVYTDNLTRYQPQDCAPAVGQWIEASGYVAADGSLRATYVECGTADATVEVSGVITAIGVGSLTLGGTTLVNVGSDVYDLAQLSVGMYIEITAVTPAPAETTLTALELEIKEGGLGGGDGDSGEVSGLITTLDLAADTLTVTGQAVKLAAGTRYSGGAYTDLALGVRVEVHGYFSSGVLVADSVEFEDALKAGSMVDSVLGNSFTLQGLPGVTVSYDPLLVESDIALPPTVGDAVSVRGRLDTAAGGVTLLATQIEAADPAVAELQAPLDSIAADRSYIMVLGVQVPTPSGIDYVVNDQPVSRNSFFNTLQVGALVDVHGSVSGGVVSWGEVELEH